jgi:cytochrome c553
LRDQLEALATGKRKNPIMQPIAQALSPEQRTQVAAYYAGLAPANATVDRTPRDTSDTGAWLATRGRWADGVPACAQCHGPGGAGVGANFPPLAGQPATYLAQQLKAWQSGDRPPGPLGLMEAIARKLKEPDIQAVSDYYAGLAQPAPAAAASAVRGKP